MNEADEFAPESPWALPRVEESVCYHSITYPDGETIEGAWDIRGLFDQYIGNYPIRGKTVLDVGTAGGFLAFEEEAGPAIDPGDRRDPARGGAGRRLTADRPSGRFVACSIRKASRSPPGGEGRTRSPTRWPGP